MAIYHLSVKMIGRTSGRDATAASAYRAAEKIHDERTGLTHNYLSRKNNVLAESVFMPLNSEWRPSRSELWNAVEAKNKRKDAQTAREIDIALPVELSDGERWELVSSFSQALVSRYGVAADAVIHAPRGDNKNFHSHIMLSTDVIEGNAIGKKNREMNSREELGYIRKMWEDFSNQALVRVGRDDVRIDCRTLKEQGVDSEPTTHEGVAVAAMERRGISTELRAENLRRKGLEREREEIQREIAAVKDDIRAEVTEEKWEIIETGLKRLADEAVILWENEFSAQKIERDKIAAQRKRADEAAAAKKLVEEAEREKVAEQEKLNAAAAEASLKMEQSQREEADEELREKLKMPCLILDMGDDSVERPFDPASSFFQRKGLLRANFKAIVDDDRRQIRYLDLEVNKIAFVFERNQFRIVRDDERTLLVALQAAQSKWEVVKIESPRTATLDICLRLGDEHGFQIRFPKGYLETTYRDTPDIVALKQKMLGKTPEQAQKSDEEQTQTPHDIDVPEPTDDGEQQDDTLITSKNMTVGDARAVLEIIRENIRGDTTHPAWRDAQWTVQRMANSRENKTVPEREAEEILEAFELSKLSAREARKRESHGR